MPEIGEIKHDLRLGMKYIWQPCNDCGRERWVQLNKDGQLHNLRCRSCANQLKNYRNGQKRSNGRVKLLSKGHPRADYWGYVWRSILVVEASGATIPEGSVVHHKNGNIIDDRIENLEVVTSKEHKRLHRLTKQS